jgi:8-oxo-dGTP pyrophosphatase MutT (NUDIX family)
VTPDLLERLRAAVDPLPDADSASGSASGSASTSVDSSSAPAPASASDGRTRKGAAVLLLADPATPGLPLLFMRRTRLVRSHRGQIAFPGGGVEPGDGGPAATALREAKEELGVPPDHVEVLGLLRSVTTATSERHLVPVVALQRAPIQPVPDGFEVADWFRVPITELLTAPLTSRRVPGGGRDGFVRFYEVGGRVIWGATAAILHDLLTRLGRTD